MLLGFIPRSGDAMSSTPSVTSRSGSTPAAMRISGPLIIRSMSVPTRFWRRAAARSSPLPKAPPRCSVSRDTSARSSNSRALRGGSADPKRAVPRSSTQEKSMASATRSTLNPSISTTWSSAGRPVTSEPGSSIRSTHASSACPVHTTRSWPMLPGSMDPDTHARFLDYLELRRYFARGPDTPELSAAEFAELDAELRVLLREEQQGACQPAAVRRIVQLRRILLRD